MNELFKTVLSLSVSGGLLILLLLACRPLWKPRASKRWQYYIWLIVLLRLLVPFTPGANLVGTAFRQAGEAAAVIGTLVQPDGDPAPQALPGADTAPAEAVTAGGAADAAPAPGAQPAARPGTLSVWEVLALVRSWAWLVWLVGALGLLVHKAVQYRSFVQYLRAGGAAVDDPALLDMAACVGQRAGMKRPVELCVNPLVSSPMLVGVLRPCIVLPTLKIPDWELEYTLLHEMTHCRRYDGMYKWLVQLAVCIHWFNPLVYRMEKEIGRACELSCDELVLHGLDAPGRQAYGETLLHAAALNSGFIRPPAAAALHEGKELLKERLESIKKYRRHSRRAAAGGLAAALALLLCACTAGAYRPFSDGTGALPGAQQSAPSGAALPVEGSINVGQAVRSIRVDWVSGQVQVSAYDGDAVVFSETANRPLDDATKLYYYTEDGALYIRFAEARNYNEKLDGLRKELTLLVPRSMTLDALELDIVSAGAAVNGGSFHKMELDTVSGAVSVNGVSAGELEVDTVSGSVKVENTAVSGAFNVDTISGSVTAGPTGAREVGMETTSGPIRVVETAVPRTAKLTSTSGSVELTLPRDAAFGARAATTGGRISSDFAALESSRQGRRCIFGTTTDTNITLQTTSGSIALHAAG